MSVKQHRHTSTYVDAVVSEPRVGAVSKGSFQCVLSQKKFINSAGGVSAEKR